MRIFFYYPISLLFIAFSLASVANTNHSKASRMRIKSDTEIKIESFHEKAQVFIIEITKEPAVGPNYVKTEDLIKAIDMPIQAEQFVKNKANYIGSLFVLKKDLPLLFQNEVNLRKEQAKRGPKPSLSGKK